MTSSLASLGVLAIGLATVIVWTRVAQSHELRRQILAGLWSGAVATLVYDVVRVPLAQAGIPVFKAISYFGTILLGVETPTPTSELIGWSYHASNGMNFGLMYTMLVRAPGLVSAVLWGLSLEGAMLLTPYAEVFGYRRDVTFIAISLGAHVCYGLTLWLGLRAWGQPRRGVSRRALTLGLACVPVGLAGIAVDFYTRHADRLPPSPPPYIGKHLYTTWDVPEPDRLAALWVLQRFVDREARFHFVPPFTVIKYGRPFDLPEAEIRREGVRSATEVLLAARGLDGDRRLRSLGTMTHLTEVTPWLLPSNHDATTLASTIRSAAEQACGKSVSSSCLPRVFERLDGWYAGAEPSGR